MVVLFTSYKGTHFFAKMGYMLLQSFGEAIPFGAG
jgi:hypothetical protein